MLSKVKAKAVFKSVLKSAIKDGGIKYPMDYIYNDKHWQICLDKFRFYVIPHTIPDEEFEQLPKEETEPFDLKNIGKTFWDAWNYGEYATKGKIEIADLRNAVKQAKACRAYNRVIELAPDLAVTHYAHREKKDAPPEYDRIVFILNNHVAVPAEHLIQALDLIKNGRVSITKWNRPLLIGDQNEDAFALIMPMGRSFWDDVDRGEYAK